MPVTSAAIPLPPHSMLADRVDLKRAGPNAVTPGRLSRSVDIMLSLIALILASPILLIAAAAIQLSSPGPVLFFQQRAGRGRKPFRMLKLRTMYLGAEDDKELFRPFNDLKGGPCFKIRRDPRVTGVGRFLRKFSIDELPQFWNVLRGDMALVGPRPLPVDEVAGGGTDQRLRHSVRPGLTCLWQVSGRTDIPFDEWLALDLWYVRNRSLWLDMAILIKTIPAVVSGRGAY